MTPTQSSTRPTLKVNTLTIPSHQRVTRVHRDTPRTNGVSARQLALEQLELKKFHEQCRKAAAEYEKFRKEAEERNKETCCTKECVVS